MTLRYQTITKCLTPYRFGCGIRVTFTQTYSYLIKLSQGMSYLIIFGTVVIAVPPNPVVLVLCPKTYPFPYPNTVVRDLSSP